MSSRKITPLKRREDLSGQPELNVIYRQFGALIYELDTKSLSEDTILFINNRVEKINATPGSGSMLKKLLLKKQARIIRLVKKNDHIVVKDYYRNLWLVLGMVVFGIPIGAAMGGSSGNVGMLALGLPIGLAIGLAVGSEKDKKAFQDGRQLNTAVQHIFCI